MNIATAPLFWFDCLIIGAAIGIAGMVAWVVGLWYLLGGFRR